MRLQFNSEAMRQILTLPQVQAEIDRHGEAIAKACGDGYVYHSGTSYRRRSRGMVITTTRAAKLDNARNMTLVKNVRA